MNNSKKGFIIPTLLIILGLIVVGGGAYYYTHNMLTAPSVTQDIATTTLSDNSQIITKTEITSTTSNTNLDINLQAKDYVIKYIPTDHQANTLRFQFYGPAKIVGYDSQGHQTAVDTILDICRNKNCNSNSKLRLDIVRQGASGDEKSLVSVSLDSVYSEYQQWLAGGKKTSFLSSVITVKLPTQPPIDGVLKNSGWDAWIGVIYYDTDGDKQLTYVNGNDWTIGNTDEIRYSSGRTDVPKVFVSGWNFWSTNPNQEAAKEKEINGNDGFNTNYRKSFEDQISLIPIFGIDIKKSGTLLSPTPPVPVTSKTIVDDQNKKIKSDMFNVRSNGEFLWGTNNESYQNECKDGLINTTNTRLNQALNFVFKDVASGSVTTSDQHTIGIVCSSSQDSWAVSVKLIPGGMDGNVSYCVDSKGYQGVGSTDPSTHLCLKG